MSYRELEELVGAEADEEHAADVAVVVLAVDLADVAVAVGAHEHVQLLPYGVHRLAASSGRAERSQRGGERGRREMARGVWAGVGEGGI